MKRLLSTVAVDIDYDFPSTGTANQKGGHDCEASAATTPSGASYKPTLSESFRARLREPLVNWSKSGSAHEQP